MSEQTSGCPFHAAAADDIEATVDRLKTALNESLAAVCPKRQDELARHIPRGLIQPCDHGAPCAAYRDALNELSRSNGYRTHVPNALGTLTRRRSITTHAIQDLEQRLLDPDVEQALAYLRTGSAADPVPPIVIAWGHAHGIDDPARTFKCPLPIHTISYRAVESLRMLDGLIAWTRAALPHVERRFTDAITQAERLLAARTF